MKRNSVKSAFTKPLLSIVIPVYNEAGNIRLTMDAIKKNIHTPHEIIVVYDMNNDTTLPHLRKIMKQNKRVRAIKNIIKKGPSGAIRTGFAKAKTERILVMMADLCDDISKIDKYVKLVPAKTDILCPSRYCKGGGQVVESHYKALFPQTAGFMLKLLTGIKTSDPTNSFKLYSKELLESLNLQSTVSFSLTLEIIAKSHIMRKRISETPTVWHDRQHGKTNFKILPSIATYLPWFSLALLNNRLFSFPPNLINKIFPHFFKNL